VPDNKIITLLIHPNDPAFGRFSEICSWDYDNVLHSTIGRIQYRYKEMASDDWKVIDVP
jgi:hypothetical protein